MGDAPSRRLRLRFFPDDERAIQDALRLTKHSSKSNVIRAALIFYEQAWSSKRGGFRVVCRRPDADGSLNVFDPAFLRDAAGADDTVKAKRPKTEKSVEIRVTPSDCERIEALLAMEAADTASEAVRRAIRLYSAAVARCRDGCEVVAISPSGDVLPVAVTGLGTSPARVRGEAMAERGAEAAGGAAPLLPGALIDLLPRSLADLVRSLAGRENCPSELLLVDMIRAEAVARLNHLEGREVVEPIVPAGEPVAAEEPAPAERAAVASAPEPATGELEIQAVAKVLDRMADSIEKVVRIVSATEKDDQQTELFDLFSDTFAEAPPEATTTPEKAALGAASPEHQLFQRAKELDDRLTTLVALTERQEQRSTHGTARVPRPNRGKREKTPGNGGDSPKTEWPLILVPDEGTEREQRAREPQPVMPLETRTSAESA